MKRTVVGVAMLAILAGTPMMASSASAAPPNTTTVTLACDKGASADVTLDLYESRLASDPLNVEDIALSCPDENTGRDRIRMVIEIPGLVPATWVEITQWTASDGNCTGGGTIGVAIPYKAECLNAFGVGSQLTVR